MLVSETQMQDSDEADDLNLEHPSDGASCSIPIEAQPDVANIYASGTFASSSSVTRRVLPEVAYMIYEEATL